MLRLKLPRTPKLIAQGYHYSTKGKKYIQIYQYSMMLAVKIRLERHKDLHLIYDRCYPYSFTDNFLVVRIDMNSERVFDKIDTILNNIWYE